MDNKEMFERLRDMGAEVDNTLERVMGDEELYAKYLHNLCNDRSIVELRKAVDAGDCERAAREVHTLKGLALSLGLLPLSDDCMGMLMDFRAGKNEEALAQIGTIEDDFKAWTDAIQG